MSEVSKAIPLSELEKWLDYLTEIIKPDVVYEENQLRMAHIALKSNKEYAKILAHKINKYLGDYYG